MNKKFLGSVVSVLAGWVCGWICLTGIEFFANSQYKWDHLSMAIEGDLGGFLLMGIFIVPSWLIMFMPIYMLTSADSFIWRLYICLPLGAVAGGLVLQAFFTYSELFTYRTDWIRALDICWPLVIPAAVVGAITCLTAKMTFKRFSD